MNKMSKELCYPTLPLVTTQMQKILDLDDTSVGDTAIIAMMPFKGYGQEDAFIFKKEAIERGLFWYVKYVTCYVELKDTTEFREIIKKPTPREGENLRNYDHLDDKGVVRLGSKVEKGNYLIGKVRKYITINPETGAKEEHEENKSLTVGLGEDGVVERVLITFNDVGQMIIKIRIRNVKKPKPGTSLL